MSDYSEDDDPLQMGIDPAQMQLGLKNDEGRRGMALMLAINYYTKTIIPDAEYLREIKRESNGQAVEPVNHRKLLAIASEFDAFLRGDPSMIQSVNFGGREIASGTLEQSGDGGDEP